MPELESFKVGQTVQVTSIFMDRNKSHAEYSLQPTFGGINTAEVWNRHLIGRVTRVVANAKEKHHTQYEISVNFPELPQYSKDHFSFSEDELELDSASVARDRAEQEAQEQAERYWIEDLI